MSDEILSPSLLKLNFNRYYRVNFIDRVNGKPIQQGVGEVTSSDVDTQWKDMINVEKLSDSHYKVLIEMPSCLYGGIVGSKGSTKRRLELETNTKICIPGAQISKPVDVIYIEGQTRSDVCTAFSRIKTLEKSLRKRNVGVTHFLSLPLNYGDIQANFITFKQNILAENFAVIDEELFVSPSRLHITICVFVLLNDSERTTVVKKLESCRQFSTNLKTPFTIKVAGLDIMNDDPSSVSVLYGRVEAPAFEEFSNRVRAFFHSALTFDTEKDVKLHMTLMKTSNWKNVQYKNRSRFDAREILKKYGNFDFGSVECSKLDLCIPKSALDYYEISASLEL